MDLQKYKRIRPLSPDEVPGAIEYLTQIPELKALYQSFPFPYSWEEQLAILKTCHSVEEFKTRVSYFWVKFVIDHTCCSVTLSGTEHIRKDKAYTYISNHRDIVLDSAFLNVLLADAQAKFPQIAIGDNLMILPWIETLVKLNGSFLVRRNLQGREVLLAAKELSEYMHDAIAEGNSLWIAQREGRAKDSSDQTQPALLKMLALGAKSKDIRSALEDLSIVPVTCSYEFDPCDYLKAQEMQLKRDVADYKKSPADDGLNMKTGILGRKGRVVLHLGRPLSELMQGASDANTPEVIAQIIDKEIHSTYQLYPINYVAYDELFGGNSQHAHYTEEEKQDALRYFDERLSLIQLPAPLAPDRGFLRQCLLTMYANPVKSSLGV